MCQSTNSKIGLGNTGLMLRLKINLKSLLVLPIDTPAPVVVIRIKNSQFRPATAAKPELIVSSQTEVRELSTKAHHFSLK